jgi:GntR family negative regulator for fad regulon and positive regulator of fabA
MSQTTLPDWDTPKKPAEFAEARLIDAILDGFFPIDSNLPAERELAAQLGVTRPTLREALQRMARDGWIEIRHGKATRVRDYWHEGNLGVLSAIVRHSTHLPDNFVANLLIVRQVMAPVYTRLAVANKPGEIAALLKNYPGLPDRSDDFAQADWELHYRLTIASGNPIFTMILNGFCDFYQDMARLYFSSPASRRNSRRFYIDLLTAAIAKDPEKAEAVVRQVMADSLKLWQEALKQTPAAQPEGAA